MYIFSIHDLFILSQEFSQEPVIPVYSARPDMVKKALKYVHSTSINKLDGKELELLIAILPDNNGSLYGMILRYSSTLYYFIF
jgi:eukaryotic translation initiation factor 2C